MSRQHCSSRFILGRDGGGLDWDCWPGLISWSLCWSSSDRSLVLWSQCWRLGLVRFGWNSWSGDVLRSLERWFVVAGFILRSYSGVVSLKNIIGGHWSIAGVNIDNVRLVSSGGDVDGLRWLGWSRDMVLVVDNMSEVIRLSCRSCSNGGVNCHNLVSLLHRLTDRLEIFNLDSSLQFGGKIFIKVNWSPASVVQLHSGSWISSHLLRRRMNTRMATMSCMMNRLRTQVGKVEVEWWEDGVELSGGSLTSCLVLSVSRSELSLAGWSQVMMSH